MVEGLEDLEIRERVETIQTTALLRSARILRRVLEIEKTSSNSSEKLSVIADVKNSQRNKIIIIITMIIIMINGKKNNYAGVLSN